MYFVTESDCTPCSILFLIPIDGDLCLPITISLALKNNAHYQYACILMTFCISISIYTERHTMHLLSEYVLAFDLSLTGDICLVTSQRSEFGSEEENLADMRS